MLLYCEHEEYLEALSEGEATAIQLIGTTAIHDLPSLVQSEEPELLAISLSLPSENGWKALTRVNEMPEGSPIRTLLLLSEESRDGVLDLGSFWSVGRGSAVDQVLTKMSVSGEGGLSRSLVIAEPDREARGRLDDLLRRTGSTIHWVDDGYAALEALEQEGAAVVILNLMMPRLDAISTLIRARVSEAARDIPFLILVPEELAPGELRRLNEAIERAIALSPLPQRPVRDILLTQVESGRGELAAHG